MTKQAKDGKMDTSGKILLFVYALVVALAIYAWFSNIKTGKHLKHYEPDDDDKDYLVPFGK